MSPKRKPNKFGPPLSSPPAGSKRQGLSISMDAEDIKSLRRISAETDTPISQLLGPLVKRLIRKLA